MGARIIMFVPSKFPVCGIADYARRLAKAETDLGGEVRTLPDTVCNLLMVGFSRTSVIHLHHEYALFNPVFFLLLCPWWMFTLQIHKLVVTRHSSTPRFDHFCWPKRMLARAYVKMADFLLENTADRVVTLREIPLGVY